MDFEFTEEERLWQKTVNDFIDKEITCEYIRQCDRQRRYPSEGYQKIAKQGWLGLILPEEYGGIGADPMMYTIFCEAMGKYGPDFTLTVTIPMYVAVAITKYGTPEQKAELLPRFLEGKLRFAFSMTEPNAGSDAANQMTRALSDGDCFILNGQKVFATGSHIENTIIEIVTRTSADPGKPKREGLTCFLVPNTTPGLDIRKLEPVARRASGTNEIFLSEVRVPGQNMLGELGKGWEVITGTLALERISLAGAYVGCAQTAVNTALNYAKTRVQFGQPISKFQVIKHMLVQMQTEVDAARMLTYRAAWTLKRGRPAMSLVSQAKYFTAEVLYKVAGDGMQILGGYGQMPEYDIERYWREGKQAMVGGGTTQIQKEVIAKEMGL